MKAVVIPTTIPILDSGCKGEGWVVGPFDEQNDYFLFDHPGVSLTISSFQVSRSRGGRYACRQSGIFLCVEPSLLEHNGGIVTCCFSQRYRSQAVVKRSNSKSTIEFP
jgi:hypothetical protein